MTNDISRRAFVAAAGTVLASVALPLASGPARAFADDLAALAASDAADAAGSAAGVAADNIVILHTNDVHCLLTNSKTKLGYSTLVDYASDQRKKYGEANVSLVDAGDNLQGDLQGALTRGEAPAQVIAQCGYEVIGLGNHEFDYGMSQFFALRQTESTPVVCCNFLDKGGSRVFDAYRVKEYQVAGKTVRVAYVGVLTPTTITASTPSSFKDDSGNVIYSFCADATGELLYKTVQAAVDDARATGAADYVVLLSHLGQDGSIEHWRSDFVVANTTGIDVVVDGHSHEMYVQTVKNKAGQDVVIAQTGTKFQSFGRVVINPVTGTATASLDATGIAAELADSAAEAADSAAEAVDSAADATAIATDATAIAAESTAIAAELVKEWDGEDAATSELIAKLEAELDVKKKVRIGTSQVKLYAYEDDGITWAVREHETNLGDFCADAFFYTAFNNGKTCDLALSNGGGIRADLNKGEVTYGDLVSVHSFMNQLCYLEVSGQHVLDMLEIGMKDVPESSGAFMQVSEGMSLTVRTDIPTPVVLSDDMSKVVKIEGERRVKNVTLDGKPIDANATYKVVSSEYNLVLGGSCMPIPDNASEVEYIGTEVDALVGYVKYTLNGVIGTAYENRAGAGRIKITDHAEEEPEPTPEPEPEPTPEPEPEPEPQPTPEPSSPDPQPQSQPDPASSTDSGRTGLTFGKEASSSNAKTSPATGDPLAGVVGTAAAAAAAGAAVAAAAVSSAAID